MTFAGNAQRCPIGATKRHLHGTGKTATQEVTEIQNASLFAPELDRKQCTEQLQVLPKQEMPCW